MLNFAVRIRDDQYQQIKLIAFEQKRSLQKQVEMILDRALKSE